MATNSRNGNKRKRNSNSDSGADSKTLSLTPEQYWKLSALQLKWEVQGKQTIILAKEAEINSLKRKIMELEHKSKMANAHTSNAAQLNLKKELDLYRIETAKQVGVKSLDPYIVDTDSLVLIHEDTLGA